MWVRLFNYLSAAYIGDADLIIEQLVFEGDEAYRVFFRWLNTSGMSKDSDSLSYLLTAFQNDKIIHYSNSSGESVIVSGNKFLFKTSDFEEQGELLLTSDATINLLCEARSLLRKYESDGGTLMKLETMLDSEDLYGCTKYEFVPYQD